jgi:hypothetical protein
LHELAASSVVAIPLGNHPAWPALLLACLRRQLVVLPLERGLAAQEQETALRICHAEAVVHEASAGETVLARRVVERVAWGGQASKQPKRAYSDTVGRVLAVPWVMFLMFMIYLIFVSYRGQVIVNWKTYLGVWLAIQLAVDVGYGSWARINFHTRFREVATWRFQRRVSWWKKLFGRGGVEPAE